MITGISVAVQLSQHGADSAGTSQEDRGAQHQTDVAGAAGRPPGEQQEGPPGQTRHHHRQGEQGHIRHT